MRQFVPSSKNRPEPICCQRCEGVSVGISGSMACCTWKCWHVTCFDAVLNVCIHPWATLLQIKCLNSVIIKWLSWIQCNGCPFYAGRTSSASPLRMMPFSTFSTLPWFQSGSSSFGTSSIFSVQPSMNQCASSCTLNSTYNGKKYAEIFLQYRWLFIKGDIFIGE